MSQYPDHEPVDNQVVQAIEEGGHYRREDLDETEDDGHCDPLEDENAPRRWIIPVVLGHSSPRRRRQPRKHSHTPA